MLAYNLSSSCSLSTKSKEEDRYETVGHFVSRFIVLSIYRRQVEEPVAFTSLKYIHTRIYVIFTTLNLI